MLAQQPSTKALAEGLIPRLDACIGRIETADVRIQSHATVYAGFLSDVVASRIDAANPLVTDMLGMVGEFCDLIDNEYPAHA